MCFAWRSKIGRVTSHGFLISRSSHQPGLGAWGFVAGFGADLPIFEHVGVDLLLTLAHDQPGMDWGKATLSFGVGAGFSVFFGQWSVSVAL